ncbi:MAG: hypothetical protein WCK67_10455 [bacterium]
MNRIVEIYTGAYTSGKSEISVNRAIELSKAGKNITLVDMDTVEPAYTLRPIKKEIEANYPINVITQEDYTGLGEAGNIITTAQQNCLLSQNDIVIDVGYGVGGLDALNILSNIDTEEDLRIYIVLNTSKHETSNVENITGYVKWTEASDASMDWKKFSGIIANPHFGDDTEIEDIKKGYEIIKKAAAVLNLPIKALCIAEKFAETFGDNYDGTEVWTLKRIMPRAFW